MDNDRSGSRKRFPGADGWLRSGVLVAAVALPVVAGLSACTAAEPSGGHRASTPTTPPSSDAPRSHPYEGMWVTADGHIRQELLPGGRYDEARGDRQSAYTGAYQVSGTSIDYQDDTGFTADGTFEGNDVLHHGGYVFYREHSEAHRQARSEQ